MKTLLVTGCSGLLGNYLVSAATDQYDVFGTYHTNQVSFSGVQTVKADLTDEASVEALWDRIDPDYVVHCAAQTDVDECERNPSRARAANVDMTEYVATQAAETDTRLIALSTDAVFDGTDSFWSEDDVPNPVNVYGQTKLESERRVRETHDDTLVIRTNIYGWNVTDATSLAEWMLGKLRRDEELPGLCDVYFSPLYAGDLSRYLLQLLDRDVTGVLHVAGSQRLSKYEFALELARVFNHDSDNITEIMIDNLDLDADRGNDLSLDVSRVENVLGESLPDVESGLKRMRDAE